MNGATRLALGTVQFGLAYGVTGNPAPMGDAAARAVLRSAAEAGVVRLDTAAAYGDIEERLGRLVGDLPFEVVSKIPALPAGFTANEAREFVHDSITRSHTRLGALLVGVLFHDAGALAGPAGAALWREAADHCARLGIACGFSGYDPDEGAALALAPAAGMAQLPGNALDQRLAATLPRLRPCEITMRSVFLQGLLLMPLAQASARVPAAAAALASWNAWCERQAHDPLTAALSIGRGLAPDFCVVGVDDARQLEQIAVAWHHARPLTAPGLACDDPAAIDPRQWPKKDS